ncbi:GNAT family N-acetyltransferase [Chromobacterium sp. IIBBL 290-4]|uniref:GNAT family N-acetyltransferase n=1 Tax=Chromobacterium sp. IIBBL 290-4 TaxID=2953890 RepID=UPI0020B63AE4|nr:GNAT family N-acetyltransferase [Chromobacterium sp. IIBBL 290-4]UTH73877.1 GNAT family N-acetyltransferase [Chromobacterium sp. IIBBL 290-4]
MPHQIVEILTESDAAACFPLMRQLRPHLDSAQAFASRWRRQSDTAGYQLLALKHEGEILALAGYRFQENLIHGLHMYVDDLVTDESRRSQGLGEALLAHLRREAERQGCVKLLLDTPLANIDGHRFYYRQGLAATALRFLQILPGAKK